MKMRPKIMGLWYKFKHQKRAFLAAFLLLTLTFFSATAELWANSRPLVLHYQGHWYFPALVSYHPTQLGITDRLTINYKSLPFEQNDWALWPPVQWDPFESNKKVKTYPAPPSWSNLLGTDDRGRDVLARLLYGYRYSMGYAILVWFLSVILAVLAGGTMGYAAGWVDLIGQRIVEVFVSIPVLFLLIILVSIFQPSLILLVFLSSLFGWISLSYYIRGEFLKNRNLEFVDAARALGATHSRIIFKHILPNSLLPIITFSPFIIATQIYGLAALDYLGFGLAPPTPSWGELLQQAKNNFTVAWWLALFPSLSLFSTLVLLGLVGEGIRNAFDPRHS